MNGLNYRQYTQYLQFLSELEQCKTQEEIDRLKEKFFSIGEYAFLMGLLPEQGSEEFFSYKIRLTHEIDSQKADFKFIFGEDFKPVPGLGKAENPKNTIEDFLKQAKNCKDCDEYEKLYQEQFDFKQAVIRQLNRETTALFLDADSLPSVTVLNSPENNAALTRQAVLAGCNPFSIPTPQEVRENGMDYLMEEIERIESSYNGEVPCQESDAENAMGEGDFPEEDFYFSEGMTSVDEDVPDIPSEADYLEGGYHPPQEEKPRTLQEAHQFFIDHAYECGTPVPTLGLRNYQTGHITLVQGYEFARTEDAGQTVVLSKMNKENERVFFRISNSFYREAMNNSLIIAKAPNLTKEVTQRYYEATELDEEIQRDNTAENFWHNYKAGVMSECNNKQEAMQFAQNLVRRMSEEERQKFFAVAKKYESIKDENGKYLSYDKRILDYYDEATRGMKIKSTSIFRDYKNPNLNVLDAIKRNTEVFDREGTLIDRSLNMRIGDSIKLRLTIDSPTDRRSIRLPPTDFKVVSYSKDNNSIALISEDGKQKYIKPLDDFITMAQKLEKKQERKQRKEDWENSMEI
ncbi:MAG: hypothetical protein IJ530_04370 [Treponema sp.]|uniref:hypothetical protein n=1 Tax=Treponema sp. TaxID=166 RepID=UPI0025D00E5A|nr:hypothetical protein [Treponema sp.]MBQ8678980.1 hypothetical protein [Treponema sp.]